MTTLNPDARHAVTLRYVDQGLEHDYRQKLRPRARRQVRMTMATSIPLWPIAGLVGYPFVESGVYLWTVVAVMCLILIAILVVERGVRTLGALHLLGLVGNATAGFATIIILWFEGVFAPIGALSILMVTVFNFGFAGLPFVYTVVGNLPYVVVGMVLMLISPEMELASFQIYLLTVGTVAAAIGAYMRETAQRRDFYLSRIIADQGRELEAERKKQLGQYTLEAKIGQGGMGVVYRAKHALLRRPTAIKLLSTDDASERDLARFEREVQLTSELSHPNIIAIYDYGHSPTGEFYYAMEYLSGIDLESLVAQWGPMPPSRAVPILARVCDALQEAHHRGLIHRDVKPGNILLSRVGTRTDVVTVLDFGLVKDVDAPSELTADNQIAGTPAYLAPETLTAPDDVGPASDLYAVGAVGFFLLTAEPVFTGKTLAELCAHHIHTEPRAPSTVAEHPIPKVLDDVILRCLAKRPADRHPSARAAREALDALALEPWRDGEDWWDAFDASRDDTAPLVDTPKELTVDLRSREA